MAELDLFLLCNSFVIDQATNRVSVFDILSEVWPVRFPAVLPSAAAIAYWSFQESEKELDFQVILRFTPPNASSSSLAANFVCNRLTMRTMVTMCGIPILKEGKIKIELLLNGTLCKTSYIEIHAANPSSTERLLLYQNQPMN